MDGLCDLSKPFESFQDKCKGSNIHVRDIDSFGEAFEIPSYDVIKK